MDAAGNFVVVWTSRNQDGAGDGIFGQRLSSTGSLLGSEFPVNRVTGGDSATPAVGADQSGAFVVSWADRGINGTFHGISARRFDSLGSPVGSQFRVEDSATAARAWPTIAAVGPGRSVVAWMSNRQDASGWEVFGQRLTAPFFADGFEAGVVCRWSASLGSGDICP